MALTSTTGIKTWQMDDCYFGTTNSDANISKAASFTIGDSLLKTKYISVDSTAGAIAATIQTAVNLVAAFPDARVNDAVEFCILNHTGGNAVTVTTAAGVTLIGNMVVATDSACMFVLVFRNIGSGTEACDIYRMAG